MNRIFCIALLTVALVCAEVQAEKNSPPASATQRAQSNNTDWLHKAGYGVFIHLLPNNPEELALVEQFDVKKLADQLEEVGAGYLILTLGQNSGYFNSPNAVYDKFTNSAPGQRCSKRDLPMDLYRALDPKGIRLMLYLPCQTPNRDPKAQEAFGLPAGNKDQLIDLEFAQRWAQVIDCWAKRYGDKVAGWWFDGGYAKKVGFNEQIAQTYAKAVKQNNPRAIVTFNPGVSLVRYTQAEDYTAGELVKPFDIVPESHLVEGSQWHALTFLGTNWGKRDIRLDDESLAKWVRTATDRGGAVSLDMGPNWNPEKGPIGSLSESQMKQLLKIKTALAD
jgi:Alpha-L-fucosidase